MLHNTTEQLCTRHTVHGVSLPRKVDSSTRLRAAASQAYPHASGESNLPANPRLLACIEATP